MSDFLRQISVSPQKEKKKKCVKAIKTQASYTYSTQSQQNVWGCENVQVGNIRAIPGNGNNKTGKAKPSGSK